MLNRKTVLAGARGLPAITLPSPTIRAGNEHG